MNTKGGVGRWEKHNPPATAASCRTHGCAVGRISLLSAQIIGANIYWIMKVLALDYKYAAYA
jgi:hypothetical protein